MLLFHILYNLIFFIKIEENVISKEEIPPRSVMWCKGRESKGEFKDEDVKIMADKLVTSLHFSFSFTLNILIIIIKTIIINFLFGRWNMRSR